MGTLTEAKITKITSQNDLFQHFQLNKIKDESFKILYKKVSHIGHFRDSLSSRTLLIRFVGGTVRVK